MTEALRFLHNSAFWYAVLGESKVVFNRCMFSRVWYKLDHLNGIRVYEVDPRETALKLGEFSIQNRIVECSFVV